MIKHSEFLDFLAKDMKVHISYKDESLFMKILGVILFFNKRFMSRMTTTIMDRIWFPSRERVRVWPSHYWRTLCHELVHVVDYRDKGWWFMLSYMLPQALSLFALLGLVFQSWWFLLFLLFLAPLPAPWRKKAEMRGYAMSMAVDKWYYREDLSEGYRNDLIETFTGSGYYFMWPFKGWVRKEINLWADRINSGEIFEHGDIYRYVHDAIVEANK